MLKKTLIVLFLILLGGGFFLYLRLGSISADLEKSLPLEIQGFSQWEVSLLPEGRISAKPDSSWESCVRGEGEWKLREDQVVVKLISIWKCEPSDPETEIDPPQVLEEERFFQIQRDENHLSLELLQ